MIKLYSDIYDIVGRIKLIDPDYEIYVDGDNYIVYACGQYCLNLGKSLDARAITKLYETRVENADNIFKNIDEHNLKLDKQIDDARVEESSYKFNEIYKYANAHTKDIEYGNIFDTNWV